MPSLNNDLRVSIVTASDTKGIKDTENSLKNLDDQSDRSGGHFKSLSDSFAIGQLKFEAVSKATEFLGEQLKSCFEEANEAATGQAQLNAAIASTHDISGVTADAANELADSIQRTTPIDHEAALAAENMLLTFTSIHKDTFPAATRATMDMATAMNNGLTPNADQLKDTSIQLGIALNDPINGISRLHRVGVAFTDAQKEQIKNFQDAGNMAGAQKIVLDELSNEFGGRATAAAGTYAGKMEMLRNNIKDVKENIGTAITNGITPLATKLAEFVNTDKFQDWMKKIPGYITELFNKVQAFAASKTFHEWMKLASDAIKAVVDVLKTIIDFWSKHQAACNLVVQAIGAVVIAFLTIRQAIAVIKAIKEAWEVFQALLETNPIILIIGAIIVIVLLLAMHWSSVVAVFKQGWSDIKQWASDAWNWIKSVWDGVVNWFSGIWDKIKGGFDRAYNGMIQWAKNCVNDIVSFFTGLPGKIGDVVGNISKKIAGDVKNAFHSMHIPGFATGVTNFGGGMALVGENGPEYVSLPRGSTVYTNSQSQAMGGGGGGTTITINHLELPGVTDRQSFIAELNQDTLLSARGMALNGGLG